ncbi:5'-3' exoribonuclease 1 [Thelohanellus kitauei]|uniref:5'-3' exoribonuclease 1 n=1 Tax=Thelohanellus kitauei TaxID=669202 RepID=A0A0C2NBT3_THEKT|nr:5'-3' exoribonuclease 1 [Thelohanellus kitauei]
MGVPKFFYWITRRYPCVYQKVNQGNVADFMIQIPSFDYFYVDLNSIIHQCSHGPQSTAKTNQERFKDITASIDVYHCGRCCTICKNNPTETKKIYVKSSTNSKIRDQLKSGVSNESFDSNCISPGMM